MQDVTVIYNVTFFLRNRCIFFPMKTLFVEAKNSLFTSVSYLITTRSFWDYYFSHGFV